MIISDLADAFERHFKLDSGKLVSVSLSGDELDYFTFGFVSLVSGRRQSITVKLDVLSYNDAGKIAADGAMRWLQDHHAQVMV